MEISSYTSNIQPYGDSNGTKFALKNEVDTPNTANLNGIEQTERPQEIDNEQREKIVEQMNEFVSSINKGVAFRVDEASGRNVVTVYEATTGEVIRQIPDEEMLVVLRRLAEYTARGLLVEKV
ncbi:flagellar protein FlaG [Vibrio sagamiensis]|uniref:Protein FlaG n=1 Tax=Vibrio sagamiensis NBRC 104589 TaxID=1219064 RepID=A0A511QAK8_9VIBR|nr:flagellar protein FlaG [Vibrio sagamiensis]PNQ71473.1 flagellar biosynthesis protein FlaG [Vibrio agarivorans]GEM74323.1 protein FlaG [Vibrio sagamiensis NBRC 104589]